MNELIARNVFCRARQPVVLFLKAAIGATGAPTLNTAKSSGISAISRTGAGAYTITLSGKYKSLAGLHGQFIDSGGICDAPIVTVIADNASSGTIKIACFADDGSSTATDPGSGETMLLTIWLQNQ